jgi:peptide/nickel transport system ATP-binding protein
LAATQALLRVETLSAGYDPAAIVLAVRDISLTVCDGECVALVGESGSGKTTLARCIAGLHSRYAGSISLRGTTLAADVRHRGSDEQRAIQLIYQNPDRSLNPRRTVADQIARPLYLFRLASGTDVNREVGRLLERVRLPSTAASRFPTELSGGEKQRVAIARALAARPLLLLCDEVTSSLDVSVQGAVLELLSELRRDEALSMLYISHDLGVVATIADRILVLHDGILCEEGTVEQVLGLPQDAYTKELIAASPELPRSEALAPRP